MILQKYLSYLKELTEGKHINGKLILETYFTYYPETRDWKTTYVLEDPFSKDLSSHSIVTNLVVATESFFSQIIDEYKN